MYCIDTSSLIELKVHYSRDVFPGVWDKMSEIASSGSLIAPMAVFDELKQKDDELYAWAREHKDMVFKALEPAQIEIVKNIITRFPGLIDPDKEPPDADPFVIALAIYTNEKQKESLFVTRCVVVTEEKRGTEIHPKIPDVCGYYDIEFINLLELFRREKWEFH